MINCFSLICKNGFQLTPGEEPVGISYVELLKPEYERVHYSWKANGVSYTRDCDPIETQSLSVAPNFKYLIVKQNASKYGSDNLLVLNSDGTEYRRLPNPYRISLQYQDGDVFEFWSAQSTKEGKILVKIAVSRNLPDKPYKAEPVYGTFYDCDTWEYTPLEFIDSRNV
jgi:hypothetical protein